MWKRERDIWSILEVLTKIIFHLGLLVIFYLFSKAYLMQQDKIAIERWILDYGTAEEKQRLLQHKQQEYQQFYKFALFATKPTPETQATVETVKPIFKTSVLPTLVQQSLALVIYISNVKQRVFADQLADKLKQHQIIVKSVEVQAHTRKSNTLQILSQQGLAFAADLVSILQSYGVEVELEPPSQAITAEGDNSDFVYKLWLVE